MSKKEQGKAPVLRFKGFIDDWEQRKLGDIANVYDGTHTTPDYQKNGIMFLSVENIDTLTSKKFITKSDYLENYKHKPEYHDIFMTRIGSIGKTNILETHDPRAFYVSLALIKPKDIDPYYLKYWLSSNTTQKEIWRRTLQIAFPQKINKDEISKVQSSISKSKNEQYNIGQLLNKIDHLLLLQQRKMDNLSKIQKSLENNLFPDINHVRKLKASKNNWHTKKLNNIFNERKKCDQYSQLLSVSMTKGVYPFNPSERKDNSSSNKSNYKVVRKGDIAYNSMRMWQGACGVSKYDGIVSPAYTVITPGSNEDASFYYYYFKNNRMKFEFRRHSQGLTSDTWNLKFPLFKDITIEVPNNEKEQIRIRKLLDTLNEAIKHGNGRIRKLKLLKSFLLQKMFI